VENHFWLIKAVFNAAVEDQLIAVGPCRKIARQPVAPSHVVPLSVNQVQRLVTAALPGDHGSRDRPSPG